MENIWTIYGLYLPLPYPQLTAIKEGRTYPIPSGWMDIVSPRNFLAIERISEVMNDKK